MDIRRCRATRMQRNVLCAIYTALIYEIWRNRNLAVWSGLLHTPQQVIRGIRTVMRDRFEVLYPDSTDIVINRWLR
ncbi:unnamed protein product [Amaranthus hypochondriacus]